MRVLVACEFSGIVRDAFRARGHDAWSCDLLPSEREGPHIQGDVLAVLDQGWDLMVAHPPCTYLTNAGVRHLYENVTSRNGVRAKIYGAARYLEMRESCLFFRAFLDSRIPRKAIENPLPHCYAKEVIGAYSQVVQPWQFGHGEMKATCFWLRGLPILLPTHLPNDMFAAEQPTEREHRIHMQSPGPDRWKNRSRTYQGIANAMAEQWSNL